jgi:hypothetical protein
VLAEYAATALEYVNVGRRGTTDAARRPSPSSAERLADKALVALEPAEATDQNGFVVTQDTATQYA